ncbi:MAG: hypothetical protein XD82_0798 [Methanoculleus marisnigri]|uniref:Uncharacterized protein n=1 Tax=Methanoculleus marisnigri TaxID=2198 RepID=A0A101GP86_9EURY|nr:MAG: hypothetical protein XD82_0798 [Methanoculleus marisnigri]
MVNPMEEICTWVMITLRTAQATEAKSMASTAWQTMLF